MGVWDGGLYVQETIYILEYTLEYTTKVPCGLDVFNADVLSHILPSAHFNFAVVLLVLCMHGR